MPIEAYKRWSQKNREAFSKVPGGKALLSISDKIGALAELPGTDVIMPLGMAGKLPRVAMPRTKTWEEALQKITSRIYDRIRYGIREELVQEPSRRAVWSNSGYWYSGYSKYKPGDMIKLDANEILVPEKFIGRVNKWFAAGEAPALPLFSGSFEHSKLGRVVPSFETLPEGVIKKMEQVEPMVELHNIIGGIKKPKLPIQ